MAAARGNHCGNPRLSRNRFQPRQHRRFLQFSLLRNHDFALSELDHGTGFYAVALFMVPAGTYGAGDPGKRHLFRADLQCLSMAFKSDAPLQKNDNPAADGGFVRCRLLLTICAEDLFPLLYKKTILYRLLGKSGKPYSENLSGCHGNRRISADSGRRRFNHRIHR